MKMIVGIHKKDPTLLQKSLLKNYEKLSRLSPKNWASLYQKTSN